MVDFPVRVESSKKLSLPLFVIFNCCFHQRISENLPLVFALTSRVDLDYCMSKIQCDWFINNFKKKTWKSREKFGVRGLVRTNRFRTICFQKADHKLELWFLQIEKEDATISGYLKGEIAGRYNEAL